MAILDLKFQGTPYTYILEWTKQGKRYIGARWAKNCHPSDLWSKYFTSSKYVHEFVEIYGAPDIILIEGIFSIPEEAWKREEFLLRKYDVINSPIFLNKSIQGVWDRSDPDVRRRISETLTGFKHSEETKKKLRSRKYSLETRAKISAKRIGHTVSIETRAKIGKAHRGMRHSEETKLLLSRINKGKKLSEETCIKFRNRKVTKETRNKLSLSGKGHKVTEETRNKIRQSLLGHKHSEETKRKMTGRKVSDESKIRMSIAQTGRVHVISEETKRKISLSHKGKIQEVVKCPHCWVEGGLCLMHRYHFNNCKTLKGEKECHLTTTPISLHKLENSTE